MKVTAASEFKLTVERSRFHALLFPAAGEEEAAAVVRHRKGELQIGRAHV